MAGGDSDGSNGTDNGTDNGDAAGGTGRTGFSDDTLLGGRVRLRQPRQGYRAAVDPVLLAAAVPVRAGETVLELGLGSGAAALCLLARVPGVGAVTGLERDPALADLARANAAANGAAGRLRVVVGDLAAPPPEVGSGFDHVIANPPFAAAGTASPDAARQAAHGETDLAGWIDAAARRLRARGRLTLIHRADVLDRLMALLTPRFGAIEVIPLWPRAGVPARRVIVRARLGVRTPATLHPGVALHGETGYTPPAEAILRDGAPLFPPGPPHPQPTPADRHGGP